MGNRNNKHLGIFKGDIQNLVQSADDVYKDSYRYEDPAYNFSLIQKFLDNPISLLPLRKRYKSIKDAVEQLESELILLDPIEPYEKAFEFTCLITKLVGVLQKYPILQGSNEAMEEEELKNVVQTIFVKMKEDYSQSSSCFTV